MTKLEILEDTKNFYSADSTRRARNPSHDSCYYAIGDKEDGTYKNCALGRFLISPPHGCTLGINGLVSQSGKDNLDGLLKEDARGHSWEFWSNLQAFHDCNEFWNENGLSKFGEKRYQELVNLYYN